MFMKSLSYAVLLTVVSFPAIAQLWNANGTDIFNTNSGNVGIGTSQPSYKLEVNSGSSTNLRLTSKGSTPSSPSIDIFDSVNGTEFVLSPSSGKVDLFTYSSHSLAFGTNNMERVRILSNGNVGIGTFQPVYKLEVNSAGSTNLRLTSKGSTPSSPSIDIFDSVNGTEFVLSPSTGKVDLFTFSNHSLAFGTNNVERVRILSNGNVGIGTTMPQSTLTVKGTVHAEEVKVDLTIQGPDYVFEDDYQLTTLPELDKYIKQNKHLPEIPSAKEMAQGGINLSEMNMLLLKKVEELTLYTIDQQKEIENLKTQLQMVIRQLAEK
jgi:hypothetical protein